jgi:hypothetical protein
MRPQRRQALECKRRAAMTYNPIPPSQISRFRVAMVLAVAADILQVAIFPLFVEGAESPADDVLDFGVAAALMSLLGWHWEFAPSFLGKLVPGMDLVPFWTLAVANVYRKAKQIAVSSQAPLEKKPTVDEPHNS